MKNFQNIDELQQINLLISDLFYGNNETKDYALEFCKGYLEDIYKNY